ncbi:MAG: hypothetical protein UW32_C0001G0062 [Candidatus Wolfebacteria bacterium GW2011_GWE2_44_13]|uniref:Uncharacterized protein n=1 Tax=Candidatus Wolfebacteria bacterium GW2011_GWE2_44_13 TaxID=1619017 RepID=A0A0G1H9L1_9BACT|nr:MAG: hypothetical protein UW32_C0001G0062 [Candidatus Wolfebacteria bacterium GW2011_GWE2_44_13]
MKPIRTRAAFKTALLGKTAIRTGDVVKHDIDGVYIRRPGDSYLETLEGCRKYIFTNPGTMSVDDMQHIALEVAEFIGLITGMPVISVNCHDGAISYQIGERK